MLLFYLAIISVTNGFVFQDTSLVISLTYDITMDWNGACIYILKSKDRTIEDGYYDDKLTSSFSRTSNLQWPFTVASFTFQDYIAKYVKAAGTAAGTCSRSINVVMVGNGTKSDLEWFSQLYDFRNSIWLLFMNGTNVDNFFKKVRLSLDSGLYFINGRQGEDVPINDAYRVAPTQPLRVNTIAKWHSSRQVKVHGLPKNERRRNMEGIKLKAVSYENWPMTSFKTGEDVEKRGLDGFFAQLWFELESIQNFTVVIDSTNYLVSGLQDSNGNWSGVLGVVQRGEADVILAELCVTPDRMGVIDFSIPFTVSRYQIYFQARGWQFDVTSVFRPFHAYTWLVLALWLVVGSVSFYYTLHFSNELNRYNATQQTPASPTNAFFFILQTLCLQGCKDVPRAASARILFVVCYLLATVTLTAYSAALISSLTKKPFNKPFDTLQGILQTKYRLLLWTNTSDDEYFSLAQTQPYKEIFEKHVKSHRVEVDGYRQLYDEICKSSDSAAFSIEATMDALIAGEFKYHCHILKLSQSLSVSSHALGFAKGSPYRSMWNYNFLRMRQWGIFERNRNKYAPRGNREERPPTFQVPFFDVAEVFLFLAMAIAVSIVILLLEILSAKTNVKFKSATTFTY